MTERISRSSERVTVTHPMTRAARSGRMKPPSTVDLRRDSDDPDHEDDIVLRTLMRSQLSLTLIGFSALAALLAVVVGSLALMVRSKPGILAARLFDVPAAWWLLGVGMFPLLFLIAVAYVRKIEVLERRFSTLTNHRRSPQ